MFLQLSDLVGMSWRNNRPISIGAADIIKNSINQLQDLSALPGLRYLNGQSAIKVSPRNEYAEL